MVYSLALGWPQEGWLLFHRDGSVGEEVCHENSSVLGVRMTGSESEFCYDLRCGWY